MFKAWIFKDLEPKMSKKSDIFGSGFSFVPT